MNKTLIACVLAVLWGIPAAAQQMSPIGHIQTLQGSAVIQRGATSVVAALKAPIYPGDDIRTGANGSLGLAMADDSTLSLGPNSHLILKEFVFNPSEKRFSYITRMVKGTFAYLSGLIGKLSPASVKVEMPEATIAVRGTKLLIKVEE